jgi:hypothetical protein
MSTDEVATVERLLRQTRWPVGVITAVGTFWSVFTGLLVLAMGLGSAFSGPGPEWWFIAMLFPLVAGEGALVALGWRFVVVGSGVGGGDLVRLGRAASAFRDLTVLLAICIAALAALYVAAGFAVHAFL